MKLIVGLGNPGRIYIDSRHNIGFRVIKALAKNYKVLLKKDGGTASFNGKGIIDGQGVILTMPVTFMNLSGIAVKSLVKKYKIDLGDLLVICDDLDLEFGRLKVRARGSSGGHRGLQSIIDALNSQEFSRLRVGIGRPLRDGEEISEYVLTPFHKREQAELKGVLEKACDCCAYWAKEGINKSMNMFNPAQSKINS